MTVDVPELPMRRLLCLITTLAALLAMPALATAQTATPDPGQARREGLAARYIELSLGGNVREQVESWIETDLSQADDMTAEERAWMRSNMPNLILAMIEGLSRDLAPIYAETFTTEELEAMVAFFESPLGRSIATKQFDLVAREQAVVGAQMLIFLESMWSKYCAAFDCEDALTAPGVNMPKARTQRRQDLQR
ncbi:DUF2059 domain-containing protein [Brevundimonas sp.]|uniref:DUF2059 domain-containing protein n=1 Tax=Brevundimonas sp. TaxID=1871086 RepID=UPI0025C2C5D7|nr:DUF2059 domain-containing protein [Brevundimonas sp.]